MIRSDRQGEFRDATSAIASRAGEQVGRSPFPRVGSGRVGAPVGQDQGGVTHPGLTWCPGRPPKADPGAALMIGDFG